MVDLRAEGVNRAVGFFSRTQQGNYYNPIYTFNGLERRENQFEYAVGFRRDGLLRTSLQLPLRHVGAPPENQDIFFPVAIDIQLRTFVSKAHAVYEAARIDAPYVLGMMLRVQRPLTGAYADFTGYGEVHASTLPARDYLFPFMQVDEISATDRIIRPLCDQAHQMFGKEGSSSFNDEGLWVARYA